MDDADIATIRSTADPATGKAACLLTWGPVSALIAPEIALNTARDLMAAAARAETDIAIIDVLQNRAKMDIQAIAAMLRDIRAARPMAPGKVALRIEAVAGAGTGKPYVHVARGSMKGSMSPDGARQLALHWTEVAVATQIDARLRYVLGEYPQLTHDDIENIFTGLLNTGGEQTTRSDT